MIRLVKTLFAVALVVTTLTEDVAALESRRMLRSVDELPVRMEAVKRLPKTNDPMILDAKEKSSADDNMKTHLRMEAKLQAVTPPQAEIASLLNKTMKAGLPATMPGQFKTGALSSPPCPLATTSAPVVPVLGHGLLDITQIQKMIEQALSLMRLPTSIVPPFIIAPSTSPSPSPSPKPATASPNPNLRPDIQKQLEAMKASFGQSTSSTSNTKAPFFIPVVTLPPFRRAVPQGGLYPLAIQKLIDAARSSTSNVVPPSNPTTSPSSTFPSSPPFPASIIQKQLQAMNSSLGPSSSSTSTPKTSSFAPTIPSAPLFPSLGQGLIDVAAIQKLFDAALASAKLPKTLQVPPSPPRKS